MAGNNDFLEFADAPAGANVMNQATYAALSYLTTGVVVGLSDPTQVNKTWRQATAIAGLIGRFIAAQNFNANDDGLPANLLTAFQSALTAFLRATDSAILSFRNLTASAPGGGKTISVTADEINAETALGGSVFKKGSFSVTFNGATTGANGMDTGATPTSGDLFLYAIFNPTTVTWALLGTTAGAGAEIYGGANMPAGYTASQLVGSYKTDGSGNILAFTQFDRQIWIALAVALSSGAATTPTSVSISALVPVNAKTISGTITSGGAGLTIQATSTTALGLQATGASSTSPFAAFLLKTAQTLFYFVGSSTGSISLSGYSI